MKPASHKSICLAVYLLGGTLFFAPALQAVTTYQFTNLGTLGGTRSYALDINNSGQITGSSATGGNLHAFLYAGGVMVDLDGVSGRESEGFSINNSGQVTGWVSFTSPGAFFPHAALFSSGSISDLGTNGGTTSYGYGINASGQVVGQFIGAGAFHEGAAINNSGQVTGGGQLPGGGTEAFLYSAGTTTLLGTLGGGLSSGSDINNFGQVVGYSTITGGAMHAFSYSSSSMTDLGTLGGSQSLAFGLNNNGQIVGRSSITGDGAEHSFLYDNGTMYDLNTLTTGLNGYVLGSARAINDSGWIVGFTEDGSNTQAWLLTPTGTPLPGGIPEPSRTLLLAGASVTLLLRRRRNLVCENDSGR